MITRIPSSSDILFSRGMLILPMPIPYRDEVIQRLCWHVKLLTWLKHVETCQSCQNISHKVKGPIVVVCSMLGTKLKVIIPIFCLEYAKKTKNILISSIVALLDIFSIPHSMSNPRFQSYVGTILVDILNTWILVWILCLTILVGIDSIHTSNIIIDLSWRHQTL